MPTGKLLSKGKKVQDVDLVWEPVDLHESHETEIDFFTVGLDPFDHDQFEKDHFHEATETSVTTLVMN